jgi:hypothetical protein
MATSGTPPPPQMGPLIGQMGSARAHIGDCMLQKIYDELHDVSRQQMEGGKV